MLRNGSQCTSISVFTILNTCIVHILHVPLCICAFKSIITQSIYMYVGIGVYLYPHNSPIPQPPGFQGRRCSVHTVGGVLSPTALCLNIYILKISQTILYT